MAEILAVERLYDAVAARFVAEGTGAVNVFGWRTPAQHALGNRVAWAPGDPTGNAGATGPAKQPGRNPRSLGTLHELFTVTITGADMTAPDDERAQYKAARLLRDAWFRAVYLAAHGTFAIKSERWLTEQLERRRGAALQIVCELQAMIPDVARTGAPADVAAAIDVELADVRELDTTGGEESMPAGRGVDTQANKRMPALTTVADGDLACAIAVQRAPAPGTYVGVRVNGIDVTSIGNASSANCAAWFSGDGGLTPRAWDSIELGDTLHWNGSIAGYQLEAGADVIDFDYEEVI